MAFLFYVAIRPRDAALLSYFSFPSRCPPFIKSILSISAILAISRFLSAISSMLLPGFMIVA
jgi:hypothetical protein